MIKHGDAAGEKLLLSAEHILVYEGWDSDTSRIPGICK